MIKLFYDHQKFSTQRYGGISRYFANLIQVLTGHPDFEYQLGILISENHYIKNQIPLKKSLGRFVKSSNKAHRINQYYCEYLLRKNDFDIFHPTYYDPYFLPILKKPLVITIHDMAYEHLPTYFWSQDNLTHNKRLNIERADKIIAISETTKKDLIRYSNIDPSKIEVIYHGIDFTEPVYSEIPNLPKHYLLFVGDRNGYKNFYLFINAFKELETKYPELQIILTGGGNIGISDSEFLNRLKLRDKVSHINATDEELNYLYKHAIAFIYPSLHEGFGLPILEAFKVGCPVILSDTECFKEIAQDAACFFHPFSQEELIVLMEKVLTDSQYRCQLIEKGKTRLKDFPLDQSIQRTLDIYKSLS
jgi:glycosyltransferase involved in cell wall biosynthesis